MENEIKIEPGFQIIPDFPEKEIEYSLTYIDKTGKKCQDKGKISAPDSETARRKLEIPLKKSGARKIWICIYKKVKMEIFDGNGM